MCKRTKDENPNFPEVYHPTFIPLSPDFDPLHAPYSESGDTDEKIKHLLVGREHIANILTDLLTSKNRKRGSYLIAGYRGVGKTSVVNYAITKYKRNLSDGQKKLLEVHLNLGDKDQLTPLDIYLSIASILRKELKRNSKKYSSRPLPEFSKENLMYFILCVSSVAVLLLFLSLGFTELELLVIVLLIIIILASYNLLKNSLFRKNNEWDALDRLIDRMTSEIREVENVGFSHYVNSNFSKSKKKTPINIREVEEELTWIIGELNDKGKKIILVLDELDKLSDESEMSAIKFQHKSNSQEAIKTDSINNLLSSLKNFITTAHATFFFISG